MKSSEDLNQPENILPKRYTRGVIATVTLLTVVVGFFNSISFPLVVEQVNKITEMSKLILEGEVYTKDPEIVYHREEVLNDFQDRISDEFSIPENLRDRVGFWFDIYTQYTSNEKVIHHTQYPWLIFKVVDVTDIVNGNMPRHRWLRNVKAQKHVDAEFRNIREALKDLAAGKAVNPHNEYHVLVEKTLQDLPGNLRSKAKFASKNVRIQTGQKDFFKRGVEISPLYISGMEEIFEKHGLPTELTRIPFVESSFNKYATSKVGATGVWQFMSYTGKNFMIVNEYIDERRSPLKATEGAARLLKENHMILKRQWPLAITAWNHGPTGVRKAMKAANSTDISKIVESYQSKNFDFASSNFYSEFLAALYAEKYHDQIFNDLKYERTLDLHTVKLARSVRTKDVYRQSGLSKEDFSFFNPDIKKALEKNIKLPKGFTLVVTTSAREELKSLLQKEVPSQRKIKLSQNI